MKEISKEILKMMEELNLEAIINKERSTYFSTPLLKRMYIRFIERNIYNIISHEPLDNNYNYSKENIKKEKPKIVVYSCITGDYDIIFEPVCTFENIRYVMFTDNPKLKSKNWEIRLIDNKYKQDNNVLTNRYIKLHPQELFKNSIYDYAIYIDGNVKVIGDLTEMTYSVNKKTGLSFHRHVLRDDIYKEAKVCILLKKGNKKLIKRQIMEYKKEKFPKNFGLVECSIIVTDLLNKNAEKIYIEWWNEFVKSKSMRDQISLPYTLWRMGYKIEDLGSLGNNEYRNPKIRIYSH